MPAEWSPHEATWLAWPQDPETWPGILERIPAVWATLVHLLQEGEIVRILSRDAAMDAEIEATLGGLSATIELFRVPTRDVWIRDYGPIFVAEESEPNTPKGRLCVTDWEFNAWGGKYPGHVADTGVPSVLGKLLGLPVVPGGMVLEGGAIEVDGEGTLITTESCLLNPNRNPELTREAKESCLQHALGVERVIWLGEGIEGDDTDGHVDDLTRFVAPGRVVTAVETCESDPNYRALLDNRERLRGETDARGRRLEVVDLPMPAPVVHVLPGGERFRCPASYANFYIATETVLVPTFRCAADREALGLLGEMFPNRRVVGVDCHDVVLGMGALHCITQQQPAKTP